MFTNNYPKTPFPYPKYVCESFGTNRNKSSCEECKTMTWKMSKLERIFNFEFVHSPSREI